MKNKASKNTKTITLSIDGKIIETQKGKNLVAVIKQAGLSIPTLCYSNDQPCLGTCRVCTAEVNHRKMAVCTLVAEQDMIITIDNKELNDIRQALVELLFVEGNHYCPACEKSGDCQLQGLGYKMGMRVSRFPYRFTPYTLDFRGKWLVLEHNRCIHCKRCTNLFRDDLNHRVFAFEGKGDKTMVKMDLQREKYLSKEKARQAADLCPTGAILFKEQGFNCPIGQRKFDKQQKS